VLFRIWEHSVRRWALGPTIGTVRGNDDIVRSGSVTFGARALLTVRGQDGSWSVGLDFVLLEAHPADGRLQFVSLYASRGF
jgi:hypothetical protein